jgi:hypothetical protein
MTQHTPKSGQAATSVGVICKFCKKLHESFIIAGFPKGGVEKFPISDEQKRALCQSYCSPKYRGASAVVVKDNLKKIVT